MKPAALLRAGAAVVIVILAVALVDSARKAANVGAADLPRAEPRVQERSDTADIVVAPELRFPLVTATMLEIADRLGGTCVVSPDVNRAVPVNALGGGRVVQLRATLGDKVRAGQTLVLIASPDLSGALSDYQKARADEALARRQLERSRSLLEHGSIARKDFEAADDAEQKALVDLRATAERVRMLGGDTTQVTPYIQLTAPISGTIIEQNVTTASGVKSPDNAPNLFTVADLSHVWVLCDVYEDDVPRVRTGERATVRLNAYPGRAFEGVIGNVSQVLDPVTRTTKVRVELENPDGVMRLGMFATAELASPGRGRRVVLPATALLRIHDADWVFVKTGDHVFRRVQVQAGPAVPRRGTGTEDLQQVLGGIADGAQVVRNALQFAQVAEQR